MKVIHVAQAGRRWLHVACINKTTVDLGVPFEKLTAALQKCYDQYFVRLGVSAEIVQYKVAKPSDWHFVYFDWMSDERRAGVITT